MHKRTPNTKTRNGPGTEATRKSFALHSHVASYGTAAPQSFSAIPAFASQGITAQKDTHAGLPLPLQRKLMIGAANDPLETEADAVSDSIIRRKCSCEGSGQPCTACEEEKNKLQPKAAGAVTPTEAPPIVHQVLSSPGQLLDA